MAPVYERVSTSSRRSSGRALPPHQGINELKRARNAVVLAHNYMTPEIFHCVADVVGDSLQLAREAAKTDAEIIVQGGVHFMAETSKLLNPDKTVLIPDSRAGCSLAASITGADVRAAARGLSRRAGRHLRQHLGRGEGRVRHLLHLVQRRAGGRDASARQRVIMIPDEYLAKWVADPDQGRDHHLEGPLRGA